MDMYNVLGGLLDSKERERDKTHLTSCKRVTVLPLQFLFELGSQACVFGSVGFQFTGLVVELINLVSSIQEEVDGVGHGGVRLLGQTLSFVGRCHLLLPIMDGFFFQSQRRRDGNTQKTPAFAGTPLYPLLLLLLLMMWWLLSGGSTCQDFFHFFFVLFLFAAALPFGSFVFPFSCFLRQFTVFFGFQQFGILRS